VPRLAINKSFANKKARRISDFIKTFTFKKDHPVLYAKEA